MFTSIVEKVKFLLFMMYAQDLVLFSINELVRHDMTITQNNTSLTSYLVVIVSLSFLTWDVCNYVITNKDIPVVKILTPEEIQKINLKKNRNKIAPTEKASLSNRNIALPSNSGGNDKSGIKLSTGSKLDILNNNSKSK